MRNSLRKWFFVYFVTLATLVGIGCSSGGKSSEDGGTGGDADTDTDTDADTDSDTDIDTDTGDAGVGEDGGADAGYDAGETDSMWPNLVCDPIVPTYCGYPFPSNVFSKPDPTSPTGRRVNLFLGSLPKANLGGQTQPGPWNKADGFSASTVLLAEFKNASIEGLPTQLSIESSLDVDCPTVVIDAETGKRIPHFAGLDMSTSSANLRSFMIRPVVRLDDATRYIVAIRGVKNESGAVIEASPAFAALRDGTAFDEEESVEWRRDLYADIFERLEEAGVPKENLQLAWDFTTASQENNTAWMLAMRDKALAVVGEDGPEYEITSVDDDWNSEHIAYRIFGNMTVPLYLDQVDPGARLVFGDDDLPEQNPNKPTAKFQFEILIPNSARNEPAALLEYGHGLLGSKEQIESGHFLEFMNNYNYVFFAVDLIGFASVDQFFISGALAQGRPDMLIAMMDRQHQGMLNYLLVMRMMKGRFSKDAVYGSLIDPTLAYYHGISQGGINGGTYMALSTDVSRGVLGVMGQPYNLLLTRSVDFDPFFLILKTNYSDARDIQFLLSLLQMIWDRIEPSGYTRHIRENTLPGTPTHEVLMRAAIGDHQVTTQGAHIMARAVGALHLDSGIRDIWGLDMVTGEHAGSVLIEYDFGLPSEPTTNVPMNACDDPHEHIRRLTEAQQQLDLFLRTGVAKNFCADSTCSFPDLSGCN